MELKTRLLEQMKYCLGSILDRDTAGNRWWMRWIENTTQRRIRIAAPMNKSFGSIMCRCSTRYTSIVSRVAHCPNMVITCYWTIYQVWLSCGILGEWYAVCSDTNQGPSAGNICISLLLSHLKHYTIRNNNMMTVLFTTRQHNTGNSYHEKTTAVTITTIR